MKKVIVLGSGGHAKVVIDILNEMKAYDIIGITSASLKSGSKFMDYKVLGDDTVLDEIGNNEDIYLAMGLGGFRDNYLRKNLYSNMVNKGFRFVNAIHPDAVISKSVRFGEGMTIFPGVVVNTEVTLGNNIIIASGSTIDHESIIENHVLISAGVTVGAYSYIKESALLALGSKIVSGVTIGEKSVVAAGAVVVENIPANIKVFGIPAKSK